MAGSVQWRGAVEMGNNCTIYGDKVIEAVRQVAEYFAPVFETYAKREGKWQDRTGNLRQSLHAWVEDTSKEVISIFLSHGMWYSVFVERVRNGALGIIWPTLQAHLQPIYQMLKGIFS